MTFLKYLQELTQPTQHQVEMHQALMYHDFKHLEHAERPVDTGAVQVYLHSTGHKVTTHPDGSFAHRLPDKRIFKGTGGAAGLKKALGPPKKKEEPEDGKKEKSEESK
jgi:hypothetical protein